LFRTFIAILNMVDFGPQVRIEFKWNYYPANTLLSSLATPCPEPSLGHAVNCISPVQKGLGICSILAQIAPEYPALSSRLHPHHPPDII